MKQSQALVCSTPDTQILDGNTYKQGITAGTKKMKKAGMPELAQEIFRRHYSQLAAGESSLIAENEIRRVVNVDSYGDLDAWYAQVGQSALQRTAILKLNGGLGTTMGLNGPKSLLKVKNGLSFLEIIARQVAYSRQTFGARLPLIAVNSFNTHQQTLAALHQQSDNDSEMTLAMVQHQMPRLWRETLTPAIWPIDRTKEWCPPGHGDLFASLVTSQMLGRLLESGYEYLFVSNADNLGAVIDPRILGYAVAKKSPFVMEVAQRTKSDRKGGHLATRSNGQLCLRESAQCHPDEQELFMDIAHHRFFNTNNLWIHLPTLQHLLSSFNGILPLPLIRNQKRIDIDRADSPHVYQLETAVGSAIGLFDNAKALAVPRSRFLPVKNYEDLRHLRSNAYRLGTGYQLKATPTPRHRLPENHEIITGHKSAAAKQEIAALV